MPRPPLPILKQTDGIRLEIKSISNIPLRQIAQFADSTDRFAKLNRINLAETSDVHEDTDIIPSERQSLKQSRTTYFTVIDCCSRQLGMKQLLFCHGRRAYSP